MIVMLDNGHGINTLGKGSPYSLNGILPKLEFREWSYTRKVVDAIYRELLSRGIAVKKLVPEDKDIGLPERVRRANGIYRRDKDSFLVSVHVNAAGNGDKWLNASYWSIWTSVGETRSDIIADYIWSAANSKFIGRRVKSDRADGDNDCESNFYILRNTVCPAVLTENFFQDNLADVEYLLSDAGFGAVVDAHVEGILNYIKAFNNDKRRAR